MGKVVASDVMSLDGFIAKPDNTVGRLFGWDGRHTMDVPVMGEGRPFFGKLAAGDVLLGDPTVCIQGEQVTHLVFPVKR